MKRFCLEFTTEITFFMKSLVDGYKDYSSLEAQGALVLLLKTIDMSKCWC